MSLARSAFAQLSISCRISASSMALFFSPAIVILPRVQMLLQLTCSRRGKLSARARRLRDTRFARAECQWAFRRYGPNFHGGAVVQTWKFFGDLRGLCQA